MKACPDICGCWCVIESMCGWTDGWASIQVERKTYCCDLNSLQCPGLVHLPDSGVVFPKINVFILLCHVDILAGSVNKKAFSLKKYYF